MKAQTRFERPRAVKELLNATTNAIIAAVLAFLVTPGQTLTRAASATLVFVLSHVPLWRLRAIEAAPEQGKLTLSWFFSGNETLDVAPPFSIEKRGARITLVTGKQEIDVGRRPIVPVKTVWLEHVAKQLNALDWRDGAS